MSAHEDVTDTEFAPAGGGWFVRAAGVVGDLANPFYREERQRDVWNEAGAVGLQVVLWLGLGAAAAMAWFGGAPALPYAVAVLGVLGAAAWVSVLYAGRLGVRMESAAGVLRLRPSPTACCSCSFSPGRCGLPRRTASAPASPRAWWPAPCSR